LRSSNASITVVSTGAGASSAGYHSYATGSVAASVHAGSSSTASM